MPHCWGEVLWRGLKDDDASDGIVEPRQPPRTNFVAASTNFTYIAMGQGGYESFTKCGMVWEKLTNRDVETSGNLPPDSQWSTPC